MDFIASNRISLKLIGFHMKSTRFHWDSPDLMKSTGYYRISLKSTGFQWNLADYTKSNEIHSKIHNEIHSDFMKSGIFHMKSCEFQWNPVRFCEISEILLDYMKSYDICGFDEIHLLWCEVHLISRNLPDIMKVPV